MSEGEKGKIVALFLVGVILLVISIFTPLDELLMLSILFAIYILTRSYKTKLHWILGLTLLTLSVIVIFHNFIIPIIYTTGLLKPKVKFVVVDNKTLAIVNVDKVTVTLLDVYETKYIIEEGKVMNLYYSAREGYKIVVVRFKVENHRKEEISLFLTLRNPMLTTDKGGIYPEEWGLGFKSLFVRELPPEFWENAIRIRTTRDVDFVAPNTYAIVDILFNVPEDEKPKTIYLEIKPNLTIYKVEIPLKQDD